MIVQRPTCRPAGWIVYKYADYPIGSQVCSYRDVLSEILFRSCAHSTAKEQHLIV